jgi:tetratricopeptide (TPR) repeat protein
MVSVFVFVTVVAFQNPPVQTANGFRPPDKTVPADPVRVLSPEVRGDIQMARKMYREAIETYREGPKDSPVLANKIGIAYHQLRDLPDAKKQYERAVKLNPQYAEAVNNVGTIYYAQKSYRRAIVQYKKALRLMPESASMMSNLGTAYFARKDYNDAMKMYEEALKIDKDVFETHNSAGILLLERSVDAAERARLHYLMAKNYAKDGQTDRAIQYVRKALEEGFKERDKFVKEPEFASLKDNPEFKLLLATEQKVL